MPILFYVNLFDVGLCIVGCFCLKKESYKNYVHLLFYELYIFMIFSVIFLGWNYGYQFYCISFTVAIFFCDFCLNKNEKIRINSIAMGVFNMLLYLAMRWWTNNHPYIYSLENDLIENGLYITNIVETFFFVILYISIYSSTVNKLENELRNMAEKDPLTGLYNRRKMMGMLEQIIVPGCDKKILLAMFDVDYFKNVNDSYGHGAGDEVLRKLAMLLKNHDTNLSEYSVCRWGGEEFLAICEYDGSKNDVIEDFELIRKDVEDFDIFYEGKKINVTITIGISFYKKEFSLDDF
jgi:diguanylate cyclase (GGDEF)-like protein